MAVRFVNSNFSTRIPAITTDGLNLFKAKYVIGFSDGAYLKIEGTYNNEYNLLLSDRNPIASTDWHVATWVQMSCTKPLGEIYLSDSFSLVRDDFRVVGTAGLEVDHIFGSLEVILALISKSRLLCV